jgi:hypothetical protein
VAVLSQEFDLPGNSPAVIARFVDKALMYEFAASAGLPAPAFARASTLREIHEFAGAHGFPIVLKPTRSTASRGFSKIDTPAQIAAAFHKAQAYSDVIVQKFIGGTDIEEVTAEGICSQGRHRTLTLSRRNMYCPGINDALRYPSRLALADVCRANDRFVQLAGLQFGLTHAEYFVDRRTGQFWLTEIAARGGGVGIASHVVPWVTNVNTYDLLYGDLTRQPSNPHDLSILERPALIQFFHHDEMERLSVDQVRQIEQIAGVFFHNYRRHDFIRSEANDLNTRHSLAIFLRHSDEEIDCDLARVREVIARRA